eukprot:TRINITY_DN28089_c0_g1_i1.p1 TRINITY_DN28089_c0_g1~~TRINITY_DN28089_c0_g1_i1.p1  ORF type:complete len:670 (-),score=120.83 TRINITY_DN28089_c0_g1_i1:14-2023(-)
MKRAREQQEDQKLEETLQDRLLYTDSECHSAYDLLSAQVSGGDGDLKLLGFRQDAKQTSHWQWFTRQQTLTRVHNFANGMRFLGIGEGEKIGFMSTPREEFNIVHFACGYQKFILVSVYETLPPANAAFIVKHSEVTAFCIHAKYLENLTQILTLEPSLRNQIKRIIVLDGRENESHLQNREENAIYHYTFSQVEKLGSEHPFPPNIASPDDIDIIMYTSGTTGNPKGAMLTHKNVLSPALALETTMPLFLKTMDPNKITNISYLPYSHIFSVVIEMTILKIRGHSGVMSQTFKELTLDLETLKPMIMAGVPRVFSKIYDGVSSQISRMNFPSRWIFSTAYWWKKMWSQYGYECPMTDRLVFNKVKEKFGGNIKVFICAGAPLSPNISDFFNVVIGEVFHGYGLTETTGLGLRTEREDQIRACNSLRPYCTNYVKLVSVPEMNCYTNEIFPRGEICIKGHNVFKGYFKDPEQTKRTLDDDGWFHTGDIGMMDTPNTVKIVDRMKNIFKLSQGEYVCSETIEGLLGKSKLIRDCFIYGDSTQDYSIAIVVPNMEELLQWGLSHQVHIPESSEEACKSFEIKEIYLHEIAAVAKREHINGYECPKNIALFHIPFENIENALTPSLKIRRIFMNQYLKDIIQQVYEEGPSIQSLSSFTPSKKQHVEKSSKDE